MGNTHVSMFWKDSQTPPAPSYLVFFCRLHIRSIRFSETETLIILRFRPIAPKPAGGGEPYATVEQGIGRRVKRKYVRVRQRQSKRCAKRKFNRGKQTSPSENSVVEDAPSPEKGVVTLQLLGERSGSDEMSYGDIIPKNREKWEADLSNYKLTAECRGRVAGSGGGGSVIETWMIVECVTEGFAEVKLGFSDQERMYQLEQDTCPGFVSDLSNKVIWVNEAYKKMVAAAWEEEVVVCLVVKEELPQLCPSFACRVRVSQQKGQGQKWNKIVPCDVWRMEFGGFAWKLDVNTALSLGY